MRAVAVAILLSAAAAVGAELSGSWLVVDRVERTDYAPFRGLRVAYRVELHQEGAWLLGTGEKCAENGRALSGRQRTPIALAGSVDGGAATARYVETGHRRETEGRFSWRVRRDGAGSGRFTSTAAGSSGESRLIPLGTALPDDASTDCSRLTRE